MVLNYIDGLVSGHPLLLNLISAAQIRPQGACKTQPRDENAAKQREETFDKILEQLATLDKDKILNDLSELSRLFGSNNAASTSEDDGKAQKGQSSGQAPQASRGKRSDESRQAETLSLNEEGRHFEVRVNAEHFKPDGIVVKVREGYVTLEAREEEENEKEGTYHFRRLNRKFRLPEGVDPDAVTCEMTDQGLLTIKAPAKLQKVENERVIPVENQREQHQPKTETKVQD